MPSVSAAATWPTIRTAYDKLVVLGEKDAYEPICRHCFRQLVGREWDK